LPIDEIFFFATQDVTWWIPSWHIWKWCVLILGGVACGFINTLAGGGSLITLPLLIFLGMNPLVANGTNRLSLSVQYMISAIGFWTGGVKLSRFVVLLALPGLLGVQLGAQLASRMSPDGFRFALGIILLFAIIPIFFKAQKWFVQEDESEGKPKFALIPLFLLVGIYSGFITVGVGVWSLIVLLGMGGYSVNHANAVKALILSLYAILGTIVFLQHDQVNFLVGGVLAGGMAGGAWIATRLALKGALPWLRWVLLFAVVGASLRLLGVL